MHILKDFFWGFLLRVCLFLFHKLIFQIIFNLKYLNLFPLPTLVPITKLLQFFQLSVSFVMNDFAGQFLPFNLFHSNLAP